MILILSDGSGTHFEALKKFVMKVVSFCSVQIFWWSISPINKGGALFVFSICDHKQNARSLLTPVSDTVFYALSRGTSLNYVLHGRFNNCLFQRF